jgi:sphingolipid delta-4 desaturase
LIHDFTHWAGHPNILVNKAFAIFCNVGMGIPSALSFGVYHSDHHNYLGEENKDPDLPTRW